MGYDKVPNQTGQNFPVSTQYATFPASAVGVPSSTYDTFPTGIQTPLQIFGSSLLQWCESDDSTITVTGSGVSTWPDKSGNAKNYTQGTDANRPPLTAGVLNGLAVIQFDGTADFLSSSLDLPAPGTTPTYLSMVLLADTWTSTDNIVGATSAVRMFIEQRTTTPGVRQGATGGSAGTLDNNLVLDTWQHLEAGWTNSVADFLKIGSAVATTGVNTGNNTGTGRVVGAHLAGTGPSNIWVASIAYVNRIPTAGERTLLRSYYTSKWGSSVGV